MEGENGLFGARQPRQFFRRSKREDYDEEARNLFEKKFRFTRGDWHLPANSSLFDTEPWSIKQLQVLKSCLNFHKSQLNDFPLEEWSQHTRRRNPAGDIAWRLRTHIHPEFLTQAWSKFYECVCTYPVVADVALAAGRLTSLHLCEAPGAFVASLNHYLQLHYPDLQWQWTASTLNPYYEGNSPSNMISDDRLMAHTLQHWRFGADSTGDLMCWDNAQSLLQDAAGQVLLVTADGSVDCLERPDAQEEVTSALHYCEVITALQALAEGGTLVWKLFTMFEHSTVCLLYLVSVLFREVNIYKPVTSRPGNSEVYAVCLSYRGPHHITPYTDALRTGYGTKLYRDKALFPLEAIPEDFIEQVERCANFFSTTQCNVINNNLQAFLQKSFDGAEIKRLRAFVAEEFFRVYDVRPIALEREMLKGLLHEEYKMNTNPRDHRGSYTERAHYGSLSVGEKCESLMSYLESNSLDDSVTLPEDVITWCHFYDADCKIQLQYTYGRPLTTLSSSKFVFTPILKVYHRLVEEKDFEELRSCPNAMRTVEDVSRKYDVSTVRWKVLQLPDAAPHYDTYNKTCLQLLVEALSTLQQGDSLFLPNFEILTHFSVGLLFILCKVMFNSVGFTDGFGVVLKTFEGSERTGLLREVAGECERAGGGGAAVLGLLPIQTTNSGEFYQYVLFYNNTLYRNKSTAMLKTLKMLICNGAK